ncbi:MAG: hypothetical protein MUE59_02400 [Thiobacillaceae bacterium]|jgi:hypothetical protein|nr:hypothetical protein [Thiobacillaceae bacterium]
MSKPNFKLALPLALGILLAVGSLQAHTARAAERIVGQVTGSDVAHNKMAIDGVTYEISPQAMGKPSGRMAGTRKLSDIKPGQSVIYEVDQGVIKSLTPIDGPVPE